MQQPYGYSKAVLCLLRRGDARAAGATAETIVAAAFARYITRCESADRVARRRCDAQPHLRQFVAVAPGRSAGADC